MTLLPYISKHDAHFLLKFLFHMGTYKTHLRLASALHTLTLAIFFMAWFTQQDSKAGILWSETFCTVEFNPMLHMYTTHTVFLTEKPYSGWWNWAQHEQNLPHTHSLPPGTPYILCQNKWCRQIQLLKINETNKLWSLLSVRNWRY
jgi:hypothetical protein